MEHSWPVAGEGTPKNPPEYNLYGAPPAPLTPPAPPREYSTVDAVFAWVCLIGGYLFCRAFPVAQHPLGGLLFLLTLFSVTAVIAAVKGARFHPLPVIAAVSAVAIGGGLFVCANAFLHTIAYLYALATYMYFLYSLHAPDCTRRFCDRLAIDYLKAVIVLPFCSFGTIFAALFSGKMEKGGKQIGKIAIGAAIAVIPTAIVLGLLSYDDGFRAILNRMFAFDAAAIWGQFWSFAFAVPLGMYAFGLFVSANDGKGEKLLTEDGCRRAAVKARVASAVTMLAATAPLLFVYGVFFVSQWDYYMSAFTGELPAALSYADYAREGFFQLCAVAVINLAVIIAALAFMKRREDGRSALLTLLVCVFSASTLVLIATALAKMALYIDTYGLTPKRVYATWLMLVIAVVFVILVIGQFVRRLPTLAVCATATVAMFAALVLGGTDSAIARYNAARYLDGSLETIDMMAMRDLGDAAVPAMVGLAQELDARYGTDTPAIKIARKETHDNDQLDLVLYLQEICVDYQADDASVWAWTLPREKAQRALEDFGMM